MVDAPFGCAQGQAWFAGFDFDFDSERGTWNDNPPSRWVYCEVWKSMFSSTESWAGVPEASSPDRVATTRKPLALV